MTPTLFKNAITTGPKEQDVNLRRAVYSEHFLLTALHHFSIQCLPRQRLNSEA